MLSECCGAEGRTGAQLEAPNAQPPKTGHPKFSTMEMKEGKRFVGFLSHMKNEAAAEARLLKLELENLFLKNMFLDSDDLKDLDRLVEHVKESSCLLLLQTKSVLTRPYCLLELYEALNNEVPVVGVALRGPNAYDFGDAVAFLTHLDATLEAANPGASALLRKHGVDVLDCAHVLSSRIPQIISVELNTHSSRNVLTAAVTDIAENILLCGGPEAWSAPPLIDKKQWLEQRKTVALPQHMVPSPESAAVEVPVQHSIHTALQEDPPPNQAASPQLVTMLPGSALLQLSKSPIKGVAAIAFKLQSVTAAAAAAQHLLAECEMCSISCQHLEQVLLGLGLKLKHHPRRDELLRQISDTLATAACVMRPLAQEGLMPAPEVGTQLNDLCGQLHDTCAELEAEPEEEEEGQTHHNASVNAPEKLSGLSLAELGSAVGMETMKAKLSKLQAAAVQNNVQRDVLEMQNAVLLSQASQQEAMLAASGMEVETFMEKFPLNVTEAERILTVEKYDLMHRRMNPHLTHPTQPNPGCRRALPIPGLEAILDEIVGEATGDGLLGGRLLAAHCSVIDHHQEQIIGLRCRSDTTGEYLRASTQGLGPTPRKGAGCQYVVATGEMQCFNFLNEEERIKEDPLTAERLFLKDKLATSDPAYGELGRATEEQFFNGYQDSLP